MDSRKAFLFLSLFILVLCLFLGCAQCRTLVKQAREVELAAGAPSVASPQKKPKHKLKTKVFNVPNFPSIPSTHVPKQKPKKKVPDVPGVPSVPITNVPSVPITNVPNVPENQNSSDWGKVLKALDLITGVVTTTIVSVLVYHFKEEVRRCLSL